ncbi:MAG: hypothetical protein LBC04_02405 [Holosporaceae bacterium]|jgi:hypothetical protein|nr:hypothetical protein [Holosporaceae bacterium]
MKKIARLILFCFLINNINALSDNDAENELKQIFDHKQPFDIILVSRNSPQSKYNAIELDEIALIFACLNASIHPAKISDIKNKLSAYSPTYDADLPNISGYLNGALGALVALRKQKISEKFDEYCKQLQIPSVSSTNWKIIIFNEMFFSKKPLTKHEVEKIRELFFFFLEDKEHTILHTNFLYTTSGSFTVGDIDELKSRIQNSTNTGMRRSLIDQTSNSYHISTQNAANDAEITAYIAACNQKKRNIAVQHPVLLNRSTMSYDNKELVWYDKSTYCWESNEALKGLAPFAGQSHIYHIGDGQDHKFINVFFPKMKELLLKSISSEICYDLSCGVRHANNWVNDTVKTKLHIFASNTTQASENNEFPLDSIVSCVDPIGTMLRLGGEHNALTTVFFNKSASPVTISPHIITCLPYDNKQYNFAIVKNLVFN